MAANTRTCIGWDTCVIIDSLEKRADRYPSISPLVKQAEGRKLVVVVSTMAQAETFKLEGHTTEEAIRRIDEFFDLEWVHPEAVCGAIAKRASSLCREHGILSPDAIHVATAIFTGCKVLLTRDGVRKRGNKLAPPMLPLDGKLPLDDDTPLRIMTPEQYYGFAQLEGTPMSPFMGGGDVSSENKGASDVTAQERETETPEAGTEASDAGPA